VDLVKRAPIWVVFAYILSQLRTFCGSCHRQQLIIGVFFTFDIIVMSTLRSIRRPFNHRKLFIFFVIFIVERKWSQEHFWSSSRFRGAHPIRVAWNDDGMETMVKCSFFLSIRISFTPVCTSTVYSGNLRFLLSHSCIVFLFRCQPSLPRNDIFPLIQLF